MNLRKEFVFSDLPLLRNPEHRDFLGQLGSYSLSLFLVVPLLIGIGMPLLRPFDGDPSEGLWVRLVLLIATGGISTAAAVFPALFFLRWHRARALYASCLLPVAVTVETARLIFFREFGTQIDERILGMFQGSISPLWDFARSHYRLDWAIAAALTASAAMALRIHRNPAWFVRTGLRTLLASILLLVFSGTFALALRPDIGGANHYSPLKLSQAPLFQVALFTGSVLTKRSVFDVERLLERSSPVEAKTPYEEIERRLGEPPATYARQTVTRPGWMRRQPAHVFCFILESFEYDLVGSPSLEELAPRLNQFHREGLSVPNMLSASGATIDAIHAAMAGVSTQTRYPVPQTLAQYDLDTLPRLMKRAGYSTRFYAASHRKLGGKGDACEAYGFDEFVGCPDVDTAIPSNGWGVSDADFFAWTRTRLEEDLAAPHFVAFLNVSNHSPYSAPVADLWEDSKIPDRIVDRFVGSDRVEKCLYAKHVRYADREMGAMVDWLKANYPGSLFVFFGDHNNAKFRQERRLCVPFILWNDEVVDAGTDTRRWFGAQMDIPATLANLVLADGSSYRSLGRPVWNLDDTRLSIGADLALVARNDPAGRDEPVWSIPLQSTFSGEPSEMALPIRRKVSALEVLSWAHLNRKYLGDPGAGKE